MNNHELVEYRPGRWAKIDVMTGMFLGPARPDEVRTWRRQLDASVTTQSEHPTAAGWDQSPSSRPLTLYAYPTVLARGLPPLPKSLGGTIDKSALQEPAPKLKRGPGYPLEISRRISSSFQDHLLREPPSTSPGIDLPCPRGTEVRAWAKGKVLRSRWSPGGGRCLWIQHPGGIKTYYAHLSATWVLEGETVRAGQKIGESGSTGQSTTPHLHFSVVEDGKFVDPEPFLKT